MAGSIATFKVGIYSRTKIDAIFEPKDTVPLHIFLPPPWFCSELEVEGSSVEYLDSVKAWLLLWIFVDIILLFILPLRLFHG